MERSLCLPVHRDGVGLLYLSQWYFLKLIFFVAGLTCGSMRVQEYQWTCLEMTLWTFSTALNAMRCFPISSLSSSPYRALFCTIFCQVRKRWEYLFLAFCGVLGPQVCISAAEGAAWARPSLQPLVLLGWDPNSNLPHGQGGRESHSGLGWKGP